MVTHDVFTIEKTLEQIIPSGYFDLASILGLPHPWGSLILFFATVIFVVSVFWFGASRVFPEHPSLRWAAGAFGILLAYAIGTYGPLYAAFLLMLSIAFLVFSFFVPAYSMYKIGRGISAAFDKFWKEQKIEIMRLEKDVKKLEKDLYKIEHYVPPEIRHEIEKQIKYIEGNLGRIKGEIIKLRRQWDDKLAIKLEHDLQMLERDIANLSLIIRQIPKPFLDFKARKLIDIVYNVRIRHLYIQVKRLRKELEKLRLIFFSNSF